MLQKVTIEVDVPDGKEVEGVELAGSSCADGKTTEPFYRVKFRPRWVAPACFPEGAWVWLYASSSTWLVSNGEPREDFTGYYPDKGVSINAKELAALHGETFTPPPEKKVQVKR
jgi:hypothetical protein